ncbi:MAG: hypothetical protein ACETWR_06830 [Anaerolineae bacterium]
MLTHRPSQRYTLWLVIAGALLAVLSGWAVAIYSSAAPVIILAMGLAGLLLLGIRRRRLYYPLVVLFFVPTFLYGGIWLKYRLWIGGIPVNIIDVLVVLTGMSACLSLIGDRDQELPRRKASLAGLMLAFLGVNLIAGLQGLLCNYPLYYVIQHTSSPIYLAIIYFSTLALIHDDGQIELLVKVLLIGALIASIEQVLYFLFPSLGYSPILNRAGFFRALPSQLDQDNLSRLPASSAIQLYRNALIPSGHVLRAAILLVSGMLVGSNLLSRTRSYLLLFLYILAIVLTFSRGLWATTVVSLLALFIIAGDQGGRRTRVVGKILVILVVCLLAFWALDALLPRSVNFVQAAFERLDQLTQVPDALSSPAVSEEVGAKGRLSMARMSLKTVLEGDLFTLFLGRGHGFQGGGNKAHGSFAFYLSQAGVIGLGILLLMMLLGAKRGLEIQRRASSTLHKMTAMGLVIAVVVYGGVSGLGSGPFSSVANMPFWGVSFALLDIMAYRSIESAGNRLE